MYRHLSIVALLVWGLLTASAIAAGPPSPEVKARGADAPIDAAGRHAVITALTQQLQKNYVFPELANKLATKISARDAKGAYDQDRTIRALADALSDDLVAFAQDRHLHVMYMPDFKPQQNDAATQLPSKQDIEDTRKEVASDGYGIARVERLPGNVGYLDMRGFLPAEFTSGAYASAMQLLSGTDALILDLRLNGGGDPQAVASLLSYFFDIGDARHLNDLYWRPGNSTQQFWTTPVQGERYLRPVYVLTSGRTFSGAEECAYDFQTQKRATLVGELTGGGANPGDIKPLGHGLVAFIPTGRAINPITKTNWEHVGVKPDVAVPAAEAYNTAYAAILKSLIAKAKSSDDRDALNAILARVERGETEKPDYAPPPRLRR